MFKNLGVQLFTIRDYMRDPESADAAFEKLAALGYTEAHTAGNDFDAKIFCDLLHKHGIKIIGTHYDWNEVINNVEETIKLHRMWETTTIGTGGLLGPCRTDLDALKKYIKDFNRAAEIYAKEGFRLSYHNHHFEFVRIDGYKTIMDYLYEELDPVNISFVLDTCWVSAAGGDVVEWMEKLKGRIDILHLKDMTLKLKDNDYKPEMCEVGYGNLSWDPIMKAAERIGVKHYVVEQDDYFAGDPFNSLKMSADFLSKYRVK